MLPFVKDVAVVYLGLQIITYVLSVIAIIIIFAKIIKDF